MRRYPSMQDIDELPLEQWADQLKRARTDAGLELGSLAQTLMLSGAQLRGIESASISAFHGPGYYLRAVEKYARHLNITLEPPVTELRLTDSQIALNRVKNSPSAAKLAKRESQTLGADAMPNSSRSKTGIWLAFVLVALIGLGTWLALDEGWPTGDSEDVALKTNPAEAAKPEIVTLVVQQNTERSEPRTQSPEQTPQPTLAMAITPPVNPTLVVTKTTTDADQSQMATKPTPEPAPVLEPAPQKPPEVVQASDVIEAQFTADCWVEVRFTDGRVEQAIYKPGETLNVPAAEIARLTFGNAQAVSASRAGKAFDVMAHTRAGNNVARISDQDLR